MSEVYGGFEEALHKRLATTKAPDVWAVLGGMGAIGLRIPESLGGLGLNVAALSPVMDALGEHCLPSPFLDTSVMAAGMLLASPGAEVNALLARIATRADRVAIAGADKRLRGSVSATPAPVGWRLDGDALMTMDDGDAADILVAARTERGSTALLLVRRNAEGLTARGYPTLDGRFASDLRFINASAVLLNADADELLDRATDEAHAFLALEAAALMRRLVASTVDYAKQREQFGQSIGRFQVVQHRLVDMHIAARRTGAIARSAVAALDGHWQERGRLASAAKATAADAGRFVGQQAVQLHGGMGMTEELAVGRYFKRLTVIEGELGDRSGHVARYAALCA